MYYLAAMGELIDAIGRNFERLLRWAYPGGLLLFLIWAYSTSFGQEESEFFNELKDLTGSSWWVIFAGTIFAGFAIYIIQNKMGDITIIGMIKKTIDNDLFNKRFVRSTASFLASMAILGRRGI